MPGIYSVVMKSDWIQPMVPYLEGLLAAEGDKKTIKLDRGTARQCLTEFDNLTSVMDKMDTDWAQGSFSTKEMNLIREVATYLNLEDIKRRFSI